MISDYNDIPVLILKKSIGYYIQAITISNILLVYDAIMNINCIFQMFLDYHHLYSSSLALY